MQWKCMVTADDGAEASLTSLLCAQPDMDVINGNYKLAGIDLEKILTPAAELRPYAAQTCVQRQVRGLNSHLCIVTASGLPNGANQEHLAPHIKS